MNIGSRGVAVRALQTLLYSLNCVQGWQNPGIYDEETANAVGKLQLKLGLKGRAVDQNFGRGTRRALKRHLGIDVDLIPRECYQTRHDRPDRWMAPDGQMYSWPMKI